MTIEEVHGRIAFLQLEELWNQLCEELRPQSFFVSHRWFRACLAGAASDEEPVVLVVRDGATPVGLIPLLRQLTRWRGLPARVFALITNQDAPFSDVILPAAQPERILAAAMEHLVQRKGWHMFVGTSIRRNSPTHAGLDAFLSRQRGLTHLAARVPVLHLVGDWERYWAGRSQRFKKTVRNVANRIERLGTVTVEDIGASSVGNCLSALHHVAARSWKTRLEISVTQNPRIAAFFADLTAALLERRQLHLWVLRLDGEPIATEYHVRDGDTVYALRGDFDERYRDVSPGAHLNAHIVRSYFERGVQHYDMGPGDSAYKERWASDTEERDTFILFGRTTYGRAIHHFERHAVPYLRRARHWLHEKAIPGRAHVTAAPTKSA